MSKFTDLTGQAWDVEITDVRAAIVKEQLGIDLVALTKAHSTEIRQLFDYILAVKVVRILLKDQLTDRGINPETFGDDFRGQTLGEMQSALTLALFIFAAPIDREALETKLDLIINEENQRLDHVHEMLGDFRKIKLPELDGVTLLCIGGPVHREQKLFSGPLTEINDELYFLKYFEVNDQKVPHYVTRDASDAQLIEAGLPDPKVVARRKELMAKITLSASSLAEVLCKTFMHPDEPQLRYRRDIQTMLVDFATAVLNAAKP